MKKRWILVFAIALCMIMVLSLFASCGMLGVKKKKTSNSSSSSLKSTGGTTDGSEITEDTSYDVIVSQQVDEAEWKTAVSYFNGTNSFFSAFTGATEETDDSASSPSSRINSITQKIVGNTVYDSTPYNYTFLCKLDGNKLYYSLDMPILSAYMDSSMEFYCSLDRDGENSILHMYSKDDFGNWQMETEENSYLAKELANAFNEMDAADYDFDFSLFKYDTKKNAYVATIEESGVTARIEVKIVDSFPCVMKIVATYMGTTTNMTWYFYDLNKTTIELPTVTNGNANTELSVSDEERALMEESIEAYIDEWLADHAEKKTKVTDQSDALEDDLADENFSYYVRGREITPTVSVSFNKSKKEYTIDFEWAEGTAFSLKKKAKTVS